MRVSQRTLDVLDWPLLVERLRDHVRTPAGLRRCTPHPDSGLFAADPDAMREKLAETSEARALVQSRGAPLGSIGEIAPALLRTERGGSLGASELVDVASVVDAIHVTARALTDRADEAPRLATLSSALGHHAGIAEDISAAIGSDGSVKDSASAVLAEARTEKHRLSGELQRRLDAALHDPNVAPHLSDSFVTVRNDRYVLPVRADARGKVRGIVHDASSSGTTLFIEPQAAVDLNNRLKEAELRIEREIARILRDLSERIGLEAAAIRASLDVLRELDLAFARGALSLEQEAVAPTVGSDGVFVLPSLRHPLLRRDEAVSNDLRLGEGYSVLVLSGPNAGGKTVAMKSVALAALCARAGLHVCAGEGARIDWIDGLLADIGDAQSLRDNLSTFSAHLANLAHIVENPHGCLVVLDEIGDGTDPGEGAALAQAVLEALADSGARVIATTHYNLLKEMAAVDPRFENGSFDFDPATLAPTYRLRAGTPGASSATAVAARMGLRQDVLDRANELLDREDRQLERTLAELNESRVALERERDEARRSREHTDEERADLRTKLEQLGQRRDRLYDDMRRDLEQSFRRAHDEVATVIRELQRGGQARDAARARTKLLAIQDRARDDQIDAGLEPDAPASAPEGFEPIDWQKATAGDVVSVRNEGGRIGKGVLLGLPDRRGRVDIRVGTARMVVPRDRIGKAVQDAATSVRDRPKQENASLQLPGTGDGRGGSDTCDLRGMRVDEALDRVADALDRAALGGRHRVLLIHGLGTGALRSAVRRNLRGSPYVASFAPASQNEGGDGVTVAVLRD